MTIRVVVVDDSATMRALIAATLKSDPDIVVVGEAADPYQAREVIKQQAPDVITLDIEMPNMDGISFLEKIMRLRPTPVIMVSSLTEAGTEASLTALELGAFDCVAKPSGGAAGTFNFLVEKVKAAARAQCRPRFGKSANIREIVHHYEPNGSIVAIGSSTGGVEALIEILSRFPKNCPPTIISQHMPANFIKSFAARLNRFCQPEVCEAQEGRRLDVGHIYIAPGDQHLELIGRSIFSMHLSHAEKVNGHRPSVDVMFQSVAQHVGANAVGVILTGLGSDGAHGLLAMRQAGANTIGQDEASCVVYGMPRVAFEIGAVSRQWPLEKIGDKILALTDSRGKTS